MNKAIIIGTSLSGKTTLIKYLKEKTKLPLSEIDEELTRLNNGIFPTDTEYKHKILFPKILKELYEKSEIIFFSNTWYFDINDLKELKNKGFKIVQLSVGLETLYKRNKERIKEGYEDMEQYLKGMVEYQENVKGEVDYTIDGEQSIEDVASDLLEIIID